MTMKKLTAIVVTTAICGLAHAGTDVIHYDNFQRPGGYTLEDYQQKRGNSYG